MRGGYMEHVVMMSGGIGSWAAAKRVAEQVGPEHLTLLFTDTKFEDEDTYRFLWDAAKNIGAPLEIIADGRDIWEVFADNKFLANSRVDICSRVLKREIADKWIAERFTPATVVVYTGIDWSEIHRQERMAKRKLPWIYKAPLCEPPYLMKAELHSWAESEGIRKQRLYEIGMPHANCFTGDTTFLTEDGWKRLDDAVDTSQRVLGGSGFFTDAEIKHFGRQQVKSVKVNRHGDTKTISATPDHKWFVWDGNRCTRYSEKTTDELQPGDRLVSRYPPGVPDNLSPLPIGIMHGFVYGDGSASNHHKRWVTPARVRLCGEKDKAMLKYFVNEPKSTCDNGDVIVSGLPRYFKNLPPFEESKAYLYGWLIGYFAADGSVSKDASTVRLSSADTLGLKAAKRIASMLGIATSNIHVEMRKGFNEEDTPLYSVLFFRQTLRDDFFLIEEHIARFDYRESKDCERMTKPRSKGFHSAVSWVVESVEDAGEEDVYCAVVPDGNGFVIDGHILTHNCGGGCVKAGVGHWRHLYKQWPERYALWERKEQELYEKVPNAKPFLRVAEDGETRYMSLKQLREERLEPEAEGAACQIDMFDWGGCGCFIDVEGDNEL